MKSKNNPLQIGVTGGIGSGKSLVCKIFDTLGVPVYDADSRARWIMNHSPLLRNDIIAAFGISAYMPDGELNRQYLAAQVFNNNDKVALLNNLVHPRVGEDYAIWVEQNRRHPYLIKEAALMYESGSYQFLYKVITVFAPLEIRLQRILKRDPHRTAAEINAIVSKQMSEEEKLQRADFILYNDESHLLLPQVLTLHAQFLSMAAVNHST